MELVVGPSLNKDDVEAIRAGTMERDSVIAASGIKELENLSEDFVRDHVRALAWLVAKGRLTIRIAVPLDDYGQPIDAARAQEEGIYHHKVGVLRDTAGDEVSFSGSINETARAWTKNRESFHTYKGWEPSEAVHLEADKEMVDRYIEARAARTMVMDVPESLKSRIIQLAPDNVDELDLRQYEKPRAEVRDLRDFQQEAMKAWLFDASGNPRRKGILEMATGSGKTWVAIACLQALYRDQKMDRLLTVIAVPFKHLIPQWRDELDKADTSVAQFYEELKKWANLREQRKAEEEGLAGLEKNISERKAELKTLQERLPEVKGVIKAIAEDAASAIRGASSQANDQLSHIQNRLDETTSTWKKFIAGVDELPDGLKRIEAQIAKAMDIGEKMGRLETIAPLYKVILGEETAQEDTLPMMIILLQKFEAWLKAHLPDSGLIDSVSRLIVAMTAQASP